MNAVTRIERIARLAEVGDDDTVDPELRTVRRQPDKRRITNDVDQTPAVDVLATLQAEVERTRERYEAACLDLRRYQMSNANDTRP